MINLKKQKEELFKKAMGVPEGVTEVSEEDSEVDETNSQRKITVKRASLKYKE